MHHTPGPWQIRNGVTITDGRSDPNAGYTSGRIIAQTRSPDMSLAQRQANARLIAAAPDLLAACQEFLAWHAAHDTGGPAEAVLLAAAAVAKVTGE